MNRNLDAEIVKTIFKWRHISIGKDYNGENESLVLYPPHEEPSSDWYEYLPRVGKIHEGWHAPRYSSDLETAIRLAKHVGLPVTVADMPLVPEQLAQMALDYYKQTNPTTP